MLHRGAAVESVIPDMRIILTVHQFLPEYSSGTEVLTLDTARELRRLGHEVSIVTGYPARTPLNDSERFDEYEYDGFRITRFHHAPVPMGCQNNPTEAEYNNWLVAGFFRKFLRRVQPDVVHFFHLARLSAAAIDACAELHIPMALTPTDFWFICPTSQLRLPDNSFCSGPDANGVNCLRHLVELHQPAPTKAMVNSLPDFALEMLIAGMRRGWLSNQWFFGQVRALTERPRFLRERLNLIDRVLVPTRLMGETLVRHGLRADKIAFLPYGIQLPASTSIARTKSKVLRLGFIGTLYEHKGAHILLQAVRSTPGLQDLSVKIWGRQDEFPEYVARLREIAGDDARISFCGTFPNHDIGEVFADLDALVVPSLWYENTPLVVYSAQAARCPVIASDTPGLAEVIHHDINGYLFPAGDFASLARLLQRVASDPALLPRLSAAAHKPKTIAEYAAELDRVYQQLAHERRD